MRPTRHKNKSTRQNGKKRRKSTTCKSPNSDLILTRKADQIEDLKLELFNERGSLDNARRALKDVRDDYNRLFEKIKTDDKDLITGLQRDFNRRQEQLDRMQDETQRLRALRSSLLSVLGKTNEQGKSRETKN